MCFVVWASFKNKRSSICTNNYDLIRNFFSDHSRLYRTWGIQRGITVLQAIHGKSMGNNFGLQQRAMTATAACIQERFHGILELNNNKSIRLFTPRTPAPPMSGLTISSI
jgi:hypothetical protein